MWAVFAVLSADKLKEIFEQKASASAAKNLMTEFKANKAYNELEAMVEKDNSARAQY